MKELYSIFPIHLQRFLEVGLQMNPMPEEIRMRIMQPLILQRGREEWFWEEETGRLTKKPDQGYKVTEKDIKEVLSYISQYSFYAFEEEIRNGFLTIQGGHRVGIAGRVWCQQGKIKTFRQISFLNIRIAVERKGCADMVMPYLRKADSIYNTLIISPPGIGKTTLLRDCIRQLSQGNQEFPGRKVAVVDERSEIAACYQGIPQKDLGIRTDVMDGCSKREGMLLLIRSMSPDILGMDELGGQADFEAVEYAIHCGCRLLGTIHGENIEEIKQKPYLAKWLEMGLFERYFFLEKDEKNQRRVTIYNERFQQLC